MTGEVKTIWDIIKEIINTIEPLIIIIIPACFGIYLKVKHKMQEKEKQVNKEISDKNQKEFKDWEHDKALEIINKVQEICNYYKDIGHMDLVNYIQFENGTVTLSNLCNMFVSCLAEDTRHSEVRKLSQCMQRIPYSRLSVWIEKVVRSKDGVYIVDDFDNMFSGEYLDIFPDDSNIKSMISSLVKDNRGRIIGVCTFYYSNKCCLGNNSNSYEDDEGITEEEKIKLSEFYCMDRIKRFATSISTIFIEYNIERDNIKEKLHI